MKKLSWSLAFVLVWLVCQPIIVYAQSGGGTVRAALTCSVGDVQAQVTASADGDTVLIPNGSCPWSSGITTTKQITIQGVSSGCIVAASCGLQITDNDTNAADSLITVTTGTSFHVTLANMSFLPGTATGTYITVNGTGLPALVHDISLEQPYFQLTDTLNWLAVGGVIWNANFYSNNNLTGACGTNVGGDGGGLHVEPVGPAYDTPSTMGTLDTNGDQNLYIEDSIFSYTGQSPDVGDNGRVVLRHSQFIASSGLTHGISGAEGGRQIELYNNAFVWPAGQFKNTTRYFWGRAGTFVITNNTIQLINTGSCFGTQQSFTMAVEGAHWNAGGHGCCTTTATGSLCFHQVGSGADASIHSPSNLFTSQSPADPNMISDPNYIWNNTGTGQGSSHYGTNDASTDNCHNINPGTGVEYTTTDFYKSGTDFFYDDSSSSAGAKPGWAPFTYPHPLRTGVADESFTPTSETFPGYTLVGSSSQNEMVTFAYTGNGSLSLTKLQASTNFSWNKAGITSPSPCAPETTVLTPTNPSCAFNVAFVPGQTLGTVNGNVTATFTGDPNNSSLQLPLEGTSSEVLLSPKMLAFGTVSIGTKNLSVTVTNKGTTPLQFSGTPTITGSSQFTLVAYNAGPPVYSSCLNGTVILDQNGTCTFTVEFTHDNDSNSLSGTLTISDNDPTSPQVVNMTAKD
jgi:hypothetical protein